MVISDGFLWKLWGKFLPQGDSADATESYHPAVFHMFDVGAVAEALLPDLGRCLASHLGVDALEASQWIPFLIAAHDIGKLHPGFQQKIHPARSCVLDQSNLPRINYGDLLITGKGAYGFDHGLQSVVVLERWLKERV